LNVAVQSVPFTGWVHESTVSVNGRPIESLAVRYEWEGSIDTTNVAIVDLDQGLGGNISALDVPSSGFPVFLVGAKHLEPLRAGTVRVASVARTEPMSTSNITADNSGTGSPLMITTPLTGWFGCAGERGTGVAVLLDLAARLIDDHELLMVASLIDDHELLIAATGGHELGWFGAHHWVAQHLAARHQAAQHRTAQHVAADNDRGE
jgi:hypothetical protein